MHLPSQPVMGSLAPLTLEELDRVKLMNRTDTKFIFSRAILDGILATICEHYRILEIDGRRLFGYESLYFDTPGFDFYKHHHQGKPGRVKVRYRKYVDSGLVYFEVKKKVKDGRTDKYRIRQQTFSERLDGEERRLMDTHGIHLPLEAKVSIFFDRITLASIGSQERVTIDTNLFARDDVREQDFPGLVIAEVKQERYSRCSRFVEALREHRVPELGVSKYALSIALLRDVKQNSFKEKIRRIHKLTQHGNPRPH